MMKAAFILPYFGKFPDLFPFYLQSCGKNPAITWFIFSDQEKPVCCPDNVLFIKTGFQELRSRIQTFYDFPISLERPYRFCDFKPAYGDIFAEYLVGYDYWGYCDCDLLWGNIQKIIDNYMGKYDQIGLWGHCSLYRNEKRLTELYRQGEAYKIVFSNNYSFLFDELAFQKLLRKNKGTQAPLFELGDFHPRRFTFESVAPCGAPPDVAGQQIFVWQHDGTLMRYSLQRGAVQENEIYYIHFLKRKMTVSVQAIPGDDLLIVPNKIEKNHAPITVELILDRTPNRFYGEYWKNGLTISQIHKKLVQRFSWRRKQLKKKIAAAVENFSI